MFYTARNDSTFFRQPETLKTLSLRASRKATRGNLHTTENGRLNDEIATPATQSRNDGLNSGSLNIYFVFQLFNLLWYANKQAG